MMMRRMMMMMMMIMVMMRTMMMIMVMVTKKREEGEAARAAYSKPLPAGISDIACNHTFFLLLNSFFFCQSGSL